jgi:hypothetical protein
LREIVKPEEIVEQITSNFEGVIPKSSWGETSLFYNPNQVLPNGIYFCTIKEKNGDNDKASELDREGIFRLSIGISQRDYEKQFGSRPQRPSKGCIIDADHDFAKLDTLMPHPMYGWMSWVQVLNPSGSTFNNLLPFINEAYSKAVIKFNQKTGNNLISAEKPIMYFSNEERQAMLKLKGVGATVISRLEQIGYDSLTALKAQDAAKVTKEISEMMGSTCWHNSPQARSAIQSIIELANCGAVS